MILLDPFYERSQNREKRVSASSCLFVCLPVYPHVSARLLMDAFPSNFVLGILGRVRILAMPCMYVYMYVRVYMYVLRKLKSKMEWNKFMNVLKKWNK
jgi:hypothetical protein